MAFKHFLLIIFIMIMFGSSYPVGKLALNHSVPPILFASLRLGFMFIGLVPFWRFKLAPSSVSLPLLGFCWSMGVGTFLFMYLSLSQSSVVSPVIIGSQIAIPFGIILSSVFLKEKIGFRKWILILAAFFGVVLVAVEPSLFYEIRGLILAMIMALFYGVTQIFSRSLKNLNVTTSVAYMSLTGFVVLGSLSFFFEGNPIRFIEEFNGLGWILLVHSAWGVSLLGHMSFFYLYKFYSIGTIFPYYSLFPIFGMIQTFIIFQEIPTPLITLGGIIVIGSVFLLSQIKDKEPELS